MFQDYEKQLVTLLSKNLPDMLWVKDLEGKYIFANEAICKGLLMAESPQEVIGKSDVYFAMREREKHRSIADWHTFGELCANSDVEVMKANKAMTFEEYGNVKGKLLYLEVNKAPYYDKDGNIIGTLGSGRDITRLKAIQKKLEDSARHSENSQRIANFGTWEIDLITGETIWSSSMYTIYNEDPNTFTPSLATFMSYLNDDDKKMVQEGITNSIKNHSVEEMQFSAHRRDGKVIHILARGEAIFNEHGKATKMLGVSMDITNRVELTNELKKQKEKFEHQANHDSLTTLPNRTLLVDRLQQCIKASKRNSKKLAVIFIDLDHFKEINDSLGHEVGDKVLIEIAQRMKQKIRDMDTLARLGGDEFCVILNNIEGVKDISRVIEAGMEVVKEPIKIEENTLYLGMSVGVSVYPSDGEDVSTLLKNADAAMYKAKAQGRNTYWFYDEEMTKKAVEHIVLESALRDGIKNSEFIPYYQPQVDTKNNRIIGMELLVRWEHPEMGLVSPFKFIPLAERTGLIVQLDRLLMSLALKQVSEWYAEGLSPGVLSMNLAVKNLEASDFFESLQEIIAQSECNPRYMELEITESDIMRNPEDSIHKLQQISKMGIRLAVDDFGTGYSSLAYLKRLPINKLKIDKTFVDNLPSDEEDCAIAKTIIGLCENLHLEVIAEGVETKIQSDFLLEQGCEKVQGYYFAKPMPAEEMKEFLKNFS